MDVVVDRHEGAPPGEADLAARMRAEGLSPHGWGNAPGDTYGWHEHSHGADLAGLGHDHRQLRAALWRQKHCQVGIDHEHAASWREAVKHARQHLYHVAGEDLRRVLPGYLDRCGQPGQRGRLRRRARQQPGPRCRGPAG
jgi:hypothetical protein